MALALKSTLDGVGSLFCIRRIWLTILHQAELAHYLTSDGVGYYFTSDWVGSLLFTADWVGSLFCIGFSISRSWLTIFCCIRQHSFTVHGHIMKQFRHNVLHPRDCCHRVMRFLCSGFSTKTGPHLVPYFLSLEAVSNTARIRQDI
jgi:hypothetical protein